LREGVGQQDRQATRAGAQIQRMLNRIGILQPRRKMFRDQFGQERARHDHAFIDIETVPAEPCFIGQIGGGNALFGALVDDAQQIVDFALQQTRIHEWFELIQRQLEVGQSQHDGVPLKSMEAG